MKRYIFAYLATLLSYLLLDYIWLGLVSLQAYQAAIGHLMRDNFPVWPWAMFYLMYSAVVVKIIISVLPPNAAIRAALHGCLLGLAAYGAYNMTNYAILATWPIGITIKDWVWGTFVSGAISYCGYRVFYSKWMQQSD
ncbi:DUF2177 family protein [Alteromonas sp. ASW11-36]|uniref:DUF2177 family protein n=1 Tax=Alteromonas arenosi TaxID=3055817 RepID=A0ABT7T0U9_9ALTE|nr:DUF2177 family protein [Alteromonas sp. ASW11-36]MDM7862036.1 DUF2177 family protein [Alteromonas sp. ASW11-36]